MLVKTETLSFLDSGTLYLTEEQRKSDWLIIEVSISSYSNPLSENYRRNPPQSVYGYMTGVGRECVLFEREMRFDYQRMYEDFLVESWLSRLLCVYFSTIQKNLRELATAIQPPLPYLQTAIAGLVPVPIRALDSVRFKSLNPAQFEFITYWGVNDEENPCTLDRPDLPEPAPPQTTPRGPQPGSSSPGATPPLNGGQPVGPLTPEPPDAFPGDFAPRNIPPAPQPLYYQRGRVSSGRTANCSIAVRSATFPTPAGQFPPFFAGVRSQSPNNIPPVTFSQTSSGFCGDGRGGSFLQSGVTIEGGAVGIITWAYPVFAIFADGSWQQVAP